MPSDTVLVTYAADVVTDPGDMVIQVHPHATVQRGSTLLAGTIVVGWIAGPTPIDRHHLDKVEFTIPDDDSPQVQKKVQKMREALPVLRDLVALSPQITRRRDLDEGWGGIDWLTTPSDPEESYRVWDRRNQMRSLWAAADRGERALRPDQQALRDRYNEQRAEWDQLTAELRVPLLRAIAALGRYGLTPSQIAFPHRLPVHEVEQWLSRRTTEQVAAALSVEPSTWRGYVGRRQAPAADGHTGREPWWYHATVDLYRHTRPGRPGRPTR